MAIQLIGSVLLGAVLGRFFKVWVLVPACAFVLAAVVVGSADGEHGLLRPLLEFAVLSVTLQIGYVLDLLSFIHSRRLSQRQGEPLAGASLAPPIAETPWVMPRGGQAPRT